MQPNGTQPQTPITTEEEFNRKFWYTPEQIVVVRNPLKVPFDFTVENRRYRVEAGKEQTLTGFIANVYLDQLSRIIAQNENKFEHMIDPALRAQYYDRLIVSFQDVVPVYNEIPDYLQSNAMVDNDAQPFAHLANKPAEPVVPPAPFAPEEVAIEDTVTEPTLPEDKQFEYDGHVYELRHIEEQPVYTRDSQPIDDNEFYKAASML